MISRRGFCLVAGGAIAVGGLAAEPARAELKLSAPRATHSMVALPDGSALIIAGCSERGCGMGPASATVDRYDPKTRTISEFGRLAGPRGQGGAAVLRDGSVLLAGGWLGEGRATAGIERFDPGTRRSAEVGQMSAAQACETIALADGRVLLLGEKAADLFDPATGKVTRASQASPYLEAGSATLLADGRVLTVGGGTYGRAPTAEAHLFDPRTGRSERTGSLSGPRVKHAAVRLLDGRVLIIGGSDARGRDGGKTTGLELYDPKVGRFSRVGDTREARYKIPQAAVRLADGRVLVAGGGERPEVIDPRTWRTHSVDLELGGLLNFTTAVTLANGEVLVAGGYGERNLRPTDAAWLISRSAMD